ncbi:MAG: EAL domain-containing protein [Lachnospiraceae bacterium]|nr:EAL domain-containing protein [Lachnospiraceae bacterium]
MHNSFYFHICALLNFILCLLLMRGKGFVKRKNVIMLLMIIDCIIATSASLISHFQVFTFLGFDRTSGVGDFFIYIFHFFHCMLPLLFLYYVLHLAGLWSRISSLQKKLLILPCLIFYAVLFSNPFNSRSFVMVAGIYHRGDGILFEYIAAALYMAVSALIVVRYARSIGKRRVVSMVAFLFVVVAGVAFQFFVPGIQIENFLESVGFLCILATSENDADQRDYITGMYNRVAFEEDNMRLINASAGYTALIFRIANFSHILTTIGTKRMNTMLKDMGNWLRSNTKRRDYLYYINNGEFAITRLSGDGELKSLAGKILDVFKTYWKLDEISVAFVPELFLIEVPKDASEFDEIIAIAETDFVAKQEGGFLLEGASLNVTKRGFEVEAAIRRGLENKAFQVYYQPIYDNTSNSFHTAEALARYTDPLLGFINPDEFISVAEKAGLIPDIGLSVFETVCRDFADNSLKEAGIDFVELNVSPVQCLKSDLDIDFERVMKKYGVRPEQINLEITESASDISSDLAKENINKLKKIGFDFALDDYGTGISNISSLYELRFSIIKIDKSILWNAKNDEQSKLILDSIINMIHGLGLKIVMEGVETEEQVKYLKNMGVEYFQGFYYSRPLEKKKFISFCNNNISLT